MTTEYNGMMTVIIDGVEVKRPCKIKFQNGFPNGFSRKVPIMDDDDGLIDVTTIGDQVPKFVKACG